MKHDWTDGWVTHNGYRRCRVIASPWRKKGSLAYEHVLIVERRLGRKLTTAEAVDHLNGRKLDNRSENLRLTTFPAHGRKHAALFDRRSNGQLKPLRKRGGYR